MRKFFKIKNQFLHFIILSFPKFAPELQEEKFELIATSLKNAKAVIIYFFSDQRNQVSYLNFN